MRAAAIAPIASLLVLASCGYVGPVVPPSPEIPKSISDLSAVERGDHIVITFDTPPRTTDGLVIKHFSTIDLRIGPAITPFDFNRWSAAAKQYPVPLPPSTDTDDPKAFPITVSTPVSEWQGKRVAVAVRSAVKKDGHYSSWSNRVVFNALPPLGPPTIETKATAAGIRISWQAQRAGLRYHVFRQGPNDKAPVEIATTQKPEYLDISSQYDMPYKYSVIARQGAAESLPSEPSEITARDIFPPKVPSGITALAAPNSIEVSWQRSSEKNLKGYYLYRSVNGGPFQRLGDLITLPVYSDRNVEHGKTYRYAVAAVSQKGIASEESAVAEAAF